MSQSDNSKPLNMCRLCMTMCCQLIYVTWIIITSIKCPNYNRQHQTLRKYSINVFIVDNTYPCGDEIHIEISNVDAEQAAYARQHLRVALL